MLPAGARPCTDVSGVQVDDEHGDVSTSHAEPSVAAGSNEAKEEQMWQKDRFRDMNQQVATGRFHMMTAEPQSDITMFATIPSEPLSPLAATSRPADDEMPRSRTREQDPTVESLPRYNATQLFNARANLLRAGRNSLSQRHLTGPSSADFPVRLLLIPP